jgi:hypothetical protein
MSCCRTSPAEFIVPFDQYMESVKNSYSIGMRFKMRFEGEEAPEQRYDSCLLIGFVMKATCYLEVKCSLVASHL